MNRVCYRHFERVNLFLWLTTRSPQIRVPCMEDCSHRHRNGRVRNNKTVSCLLILGKIESQYSHIFYNCKCLRVRKSISILYSKNQQVLVSQPRHRHHHRWSHHHRITSVPHSSWAVRRGVWLGFGLISRVFSRIRSLVSHVLTLSHRYCRASRWQSVWPFALVPILVIEWGARSWVQSCMRSKILRPNRRVHSCECHSRCWWCYFSSIVTVMNILARVSLVIWR